MAERFKIEFKPLTLPGAGDVAFLVYDDLVLPSTVSADLAATVSRSASIEGFKGKALATMVTMAAPGSGHDRIVVVGLGPKADAESIDWVSLGGVIAGQMLAGRELGVFLATAAETVKPEQAADIALGARLRSYSFDRYKTKTADKDGKTRGPLSLHVIDTLKTKKAVKLKDSVAEGVCLARDLVNEPPNILGPEEFAGYAEELSKLGVEVEILGEKQLRKIGMRALLGVGQGSVRESKVAIMRWNGGKDGSKPVAFIGKGVVFDTGGISIKPAGGMEDMKGDMAGAACVVGLMHALASRKAKANVIGAIGLVENMPDGKAQRPGDIVTSLSGQTIEIINTDAEGRLVLADVLWYVQDQYKPVFMINLATLTGAILVALGKENAGLFSNNDELATRIFEAGKLTGETVWRMPMSAAYDKIIDSKFADVKNSAGRDAGSITAAHFLKRFVNDTPWAHLDIAGTAMGSPQTEINKGWASGWGVRLLNQLVAAHYEK
ncbi:MAG: leucyl aminopeptidase [Hyphomicrobiales bacterium]|nr:leucyl aminopeptidase [Hyphomicrobiales bacterium]